ncbi:hypothetical protein EW146_g5161 [Bondarzewia mesenterica]|uniref:5-hmdU DNA kinase helical domain-containing protein n=1 Tax=Bondarzewia mesenterica TaxID=1095465 RepID=A0A4S4LY45_9AGAM|nr:hypothetical protein EW146_g5161 [Bondarzewia mesenterica]
MARTHVAPKAMSHKSKNSVKTVTISNRVLPVSPVLDTLFSFIAERHAIHQRRIAGEAFPWTDDPVLLKYSFTNVFRVLDRMTQTSTYELLQERLGSLTWRDFDIDVYTGVLREAFEDGVSLYGHAYLMPAPKLGGGNNYVNHLRLLRLMMEEGLPEKLKQSTCLREAYGRISLFPTMGNFLGFQ